MILIMKSLCHVTHCTMFIFWMITCTQINADRQLHVSDHQWRHETREQWINVYSNDCRYFDDFFQSLVFEMNKNESIYNFHSYNESLECIEGNNSVQLASQICANILNCQSYQHWMFELSNETAGNNVTNINEDGIVDVLLETPFIHYTLLYNTSMMNYNETKLLTNVSIYLEQKYNQSNPSLYENVTNQILITNRISFLLNSTRTNIDFTDLSVKCHIIDEYSYSYSGYYGSGFDRLYTVTSSATQSTLAIVPTQTVCCTK